MGIDCYLFTEKEHAHRGYLYALCNCGEMKWSELPSAEQLGYIRESYHGGPYITRAIFPECFADVYERLQNDIGGKPYADIDIVCNAPPQELWERFRQNEHLIAEREACVYKASGYASEQTRTVREFLEKYEQLYLENKHPVVYISY